MLKSVSNKKNIQKKIKKRPTTYLSNKIEAESNSGLEP